MQKISKRKALEIAKSAKRITILDTEAKKYDVPSTYEELEENMRMFGSRAFCQQGNEVVYINIMNGLGFSIYSDGDYASKVLRDDQKEQLSEMDLSGDAQKNILAYVEKDKVSEERAYRVQIIGSPQNFQLLEALLEFLEAREIVRVPDEEIQEYVLYFISSVVDLSVKLQNALNTEIINGYSVGRGKWPKA